MGDDPASTATDIAKATLKGPDKSRDVPRLPFGIVLVPVTSGGQVAPINVGFLNVHNSAPFKVARPVVVAANWTMGLCIASATWLTVADAMHKAMVQLAATTTGRATLKGAEL